MNEKSKKTHFNQTKYITEWKRQNIARVIVEVKPEEKEAWKQAADKVGKSLQRFVTDTVNEKVNEIETEAD